MNRRTLRKLPEFLSQVQDASRRTPRLPEAILLGFVLDFLSRPLTALEPGGHVRIPRRSSCSPREAS